MHMADSDHSPIVISTTTTTTTKAKANTNTNTNTNESCKYKGVRKRKWGKWVSEIRLPNSRERIWLGSYDSAEKAARAFDAALFFLRGPHASFNFPHTPHEIHHQRPHRSLSSQEIQELAAKFANEHQRDASIMNSEQQMQSSESDGVTTTTTESSGDPVEVDHGVGEIRAINDWSFLNSLDDYDIGSSNSSYSNGGFYKMHSGELLFPTSPLHLLFDGYSVPDNDHYNHHIFDDSTSSMDYCDDAFSQQSFFLWNF